jgi:hypothetical protein
MIKKLSIYLLLLWFNTTNCKITPVKVPKNDNKQSNTFMQSNQNINSMHNNIDSSSEQMPQIVFGKLNLCLNI